MNNEADETKTKKRFPIEISTEIWHLLQNARTDFHQESLPLRAKASKNIVIAIDNTEAMFDTVFVRCVSQEYYIINNIMPMLNIRRIKWMYENFGVTAAVKSATYDLIAVFAYMGYCLTLPYQFVKILVQNIRSPKKIRNY